MMQRLSEVYLNKNIFKLFFVRLSFFSESKNLRDSVVHRFVTNIEPKVYFDFKGVMKTKSYALDLILIFLQLTLECQVKIKIRIVF